MRITYVGQFDEVLVPDLGRTVKQGQTIDAPSDIAEALLIQGSSEGSPGTEWKKAGGKSRPSPSSDSGDTED